MATSAETRNLRLQRLKDAVDAYANKEKAAIESTVSRLTAISSGRLGGAQLDWSSVNIISKAASNDLYSYLYIGANSRPVQSVAATTPPAGPPPAPPADQVSTPSTAVGKVVPANPANYGSRRGTKIDTIIIHVTESPNAAGSAKWFTDPAAKSCAHYIVDNDGSVVICLDDSMCAYHAGNWRVNQRSIGIEVVGYSAQSGTWTAPKLSSLEALTAKLCKKYGVPPSNTWIYGHDKVPDPNNPSKLGGAGQHTDPGAYFPWAQFLADVQSKVA